MQDVTAATKARGFDVWLLVGRTNAKVHRVLSQMLASLDLSLAQHEILMMISQHPGLTQMQLSKKLLVVKSNVSALLTKLEARGLVHREQDDQDARHKHLSLTKEGERLVTRSFRLQNRVIKAMASEVSDADLVRLEKMMRRVGGALDRLAADSE